MHIDPLIGLPVPKPDQTVVKWAVPFGENAVDKPLACAPIIRNVAKIRYIDNLHKDIFNTEIF
nr:hypothetical protein K-LCC10_0153 [Kaumoebavirus]